MVSRQLMLLLWLVNVNMAINCYRGAVYNNTPSPVEKISCPVVNFCTKITAVTPVTLATHGCDQSATLCKVPDCYDNQNGGKTCCCNTDFCNNSNRVGYLLGSVLITTFISYLIF